MKSELLKNYITKNWKMKQWKNENMKTWKTKNEKLKFQQFQNCKIEKSKNEHSIIGVTVGLWEGSKHKKNANSLRILKVKLPYSALAIQWDFESVIMLVVMFHNKQCLDMFSFLQFDRSKLRTILFFLQDEFLLENLPKEMFLNLQTQFSSNLKSEVLLICGSE